METTNQPILQHHPPPRHARPLPRQPDASAAALMLIEEVRANTQAIDRLGRLFDEFASAYLNTKFPFGKPTDRWARRS